MNQQTNIAASTASDLLQGIARALFGEAGAGITDLITLANRVQAGAGNLGSQPAELVEQQGDAPFEVTDPWRGLYLPTRMPPASEYGDLTHPDVPRWPDDREDALDKLVHAQGFDFHIVAGDFTEAALEDGDELYWEELRAWNPEAPEGEWRLAWKGDTEDGPYAWFVRPMALRPKPDAPTDRQPGAQEPIGYRWRHSAGEKWQYSDVPCGWEHEPLYAAPPAQGIDQAPLRSALQAAEALCACCAAVDGYSRNELYAFGLNMRQQFVDALRVIDGQRGAAPGVDRG